MTAARQVAVVVRCCISLVDERARLAIAEHALLVDGLPRALHAHPALLSQSERSLRPAAARQRTQPPNGTSSGAGMTPSVFFYLNLRPEINYKRVFLVLQE